MVGSAKIELKGTSDVVKEEEAEADEREGNSSE